jgi:beta-glucanase (GH16 family)
MNTIHGRAPRGANELPPPGTEPTWHDEFDSQSLDTNAWGYGMKPWGTTDNNPCLITPEDTYLENGSLVLRCRMGDFGQYHFSSGWAWSKKWFKYGYFEMRAQFPKGKGQWPAWWMLKQGWPPEIDIAEYRGTPRNYMTEAFYWGQWSTTLLYESQGWDFSTWHTYGLQWGPGYLIWYVDGQITKSYHGDQVPSDSMYLIFSAGLDGSSADSTTGFPNYLVIDYFRYYQMIGVGSCYPTPIIPNAQVNLRAWHITDSANVNPGDWIIFAPYPSSVDEGVISQGEYNLSQNHPNPFNPRCRCSMNSYVPF